MLKFEGPPIKKYRSNQNQTNAYLLTWGYRTTYKKLRLPQPLEEKKSSKFVIVTGCRRPIMSNTLLNWVLEKDNFFPK